MGNIRKNTNNNNTNTININKPNQNKEIYQTKKNFTNKNKKRFYY